MEIENGRELPDALLVNPYALGLMSEAFHQALTMPEQEQAGRMRLLREQVREQNVYRWVGRILIQAAQLDAMNEIKTMTEQGLFVRRADPHDGRRVFVELAPAASDALRRYFAQVGKPVAV